MIIVSQNHSLSLVSGSQTQSGEEVRSQRAAGAKPFRFRRRIAGFRWRGVRMSDVTRSDFFFLLSVGHPRVE